MSDKVLVPIWIAQLPAHLAAKCHGLPDVGDLPFPISAAVEVLDVWSTMPVVILGGDFWRLDTGRWRHTHAWTSGTNEELGQPDAAAHSVRNARETVGASWVDPAWHVSFVCRWEA